MVQYRNGSIIIGCLIRVHRRGENSDCAQVQEDGIQAIEAVNMIIDKV